MTGTCSFSASSTTLPVHSLMKQPPPMMITGAFAAWTISRAFLISASSGAGFSTGMGL